MLQAKIGVYALLTILAHHPGMMKSVGPLQFIRRAAVAVGLFLAAMPFTSQAADGNLPSVDRELWKMPDRALIVDAYEMNMIEWQDMVTNKRVAGFISKASDGLPEIFNCKGKHNGDTEAHCRTMWRKYAVSRELYGTRRLVARSQGLLWGAYHLGRPGSPIDQANHFLNYADPAADELMVLDLEGLDAELYMSLADAETFVRHIKARTGRYPILYTNHVTARYIANRRHEYILLSRLPLWYARYKPSIEHVFPMGNWDHYAFWQFSSAANCGRRACPYRIKGTLSDIDVNVVNMTQAELKIAWPHGGLLPEKPPEYQLLVSAQAGFSSGTSVAVAVDLVTTASTTSLVTLTASNDRE